MNNVWDDGRFGHCTYEWFVQNFLSCWRVERRTSTHQIHVYVTNSDGEMNFQAEIRISFFFASCACVRIGLLFAGMCVIREVGESSKHRCMNWRERVRTRLILVLVCIYTSTDWFLRLVLFVSFFFCLVTATAQVANIVLRRCTIVVSESK